MRRMFGRVNPRPDVVFEAVFTSFVATLRARGAKAAAEPRLEMGAVNTQSTTRAASAGARSRDAMVVDAVLKRDTPSQDYS